MTQPHDEETLRRKINSNLHQAFFEDSEDDPLTSVLYNFADGNINTRLAADDIISSITRSEDSESSSDLSTLIIFLASEYPFLQPQLVDLIRTILSDPVLAEESKSQLSSDLVVCVGDTASSNFARLFEEREMTNDLIDDHVNLHRFLARLLSLGVGVLVQMEDIFYMLSVGLEDHAASGTTRAGVDARTAAQYLIHAAEDIFDGCEKGIGRDLARTSPLWASRGSVWTGSAGLSLERWYFWKTMLAALAKGDVSEETKFAAGTAVRAMTLVDGKD